MDVAPVIGTAGRGLASAPGAQRHIVHVAARYPPALGGMEKVVQYLARAQHQLGAVVRVITSDEGRNELRHEADDVPVSRLKSFSLLRTPLMPGLLPPDRRVLPIEPLPALSQQRTGPVDGLKHALVYALDRGAEAASPLIQLALAFIRLALPLV